MFDAIHVQPLALGPSPAAQVLENSALLGTGRVFAAGDCVRRESGQATPKRIATAETQARGRCVKSAGREQRLCTHTCPICQQGEHLLTSRLRQYCNSVSRRSRLSARVWSCVLASDQCPK